MKIVFTGGGSGGHIFPIVAIVRQIKKIYKGKNLELYYIGPKEGKGIELLEKEGVKIKVILAGKFRRYFSIKNFFDVIKIPIGFIQSFFWLFLLAPDLIFSKSGYGSFPVAAVSAFLSIPLFLHESDAVPSRTSRIEAKWALQIFTSFPKKINGGGGKNIFPEDRIINVGNPIRESIISGSREEAKKVFGIDSSRKTVLIIGGSQGSAKINEIILEILSDLLNDFNVIHQIGDRNFKEIKMEAKAILFDSEKRERYYPYPFLDEFLMKNALAVSDLVVCRAGAGTIFEIAAAGKPAILIPLSSSAQNHQVVNAYSFAEIGGGEVVEEKNLKPHFILEKIRYFLNNEGLLKEMSGASKMFSRPKSAKIIASYIVEYLTPNKIT